MNNTTSPDIIDSTIKAYVDKYGVEKNLIVLVEELAELQQAICKYLRYSDNAVIRKGKEEIVDDIRGEIADVLYCMHYITGITNNAWQDYMEMTADIAVENKHRLEQTT